MTLRDREHGAEAARQKDRSLRRAEERMSEASGAAMRRFLRRMREAVSEDRLTAAVEPSARLPDIAEANGWWEDAIDEDMAGRVEEVWRTGYHDTRDGELTSGNLDRVGEHLARVKDRLSRTATPTIPERAMDTARKALAEETARGSSIRTQSQRLAAEFGWDEDATFWRERMDELDRAVDERLDAIGPPGDAAREAARLDDPDIRALQADRAEARTRIDRVESEWQTRAERISRTETTGAYNAGGRDAAATEGAQAKRWVATSDARTRDSHLAASGQCVPLGEPFDVGGAQLDMPADPSGAAHETINCRCTVVYADSCEEADGLFGDVEDVIDEERERRGVQRFDRTTGDVAETAGEADVPPDAMEPGGSATPGGALRERLDGPDDSDAYERFPTDDEIEQVDALLTDEWGVSEAGEARFALDIADGARYDEVVEAVEEYQGASHMDINATLRQTRGAFTLDTPASGTMNIQQAASAIDEAIDNAPRVRDPVTVHRGVPDPDFATRMRGLPEGAKLDDPGFMSTTINRRQAREFAGPGGHEIDVEVPPGARALYMNANLGSKFPDEMELLLGRGAQMEVVRQEQGRTVLRLVGFDRDALPEPEVE